MFRLVNTNIKMMPLVGQRGRHLAHNTCSPRQRFAFGDPAETEIILEN